MNKFDFLKNNLRKSPIIIEIGMHHGEDTLKFRNLFPDSLIIGFEPDPRCAEIIKSKNIKNLEFFKCALSDKKGEMIFYQSDSQDGWDGSGSLKKPKEHLKRFPHIDFDKSVTVPVTTLDFVLAMLVNDFEEVLLPRDEVIDLIWIDVQGSEKDVFKGALNTLKRTKYIHFEVYDGVEMYENQPTLKEIMNQLGPDWIIIGDDGEGNKIVENINVQLNK